MDECHTVMKVIPPFQKFIWKEAMDLFWKQNITAWIVSEFTAVNAAQ